jgi:hypothetical protein
VLGILSKDFFTFVWGLISTSYATYQAQQAAAAQAQADADQLQNAKTQGDKTDAATQINNDTFGSGTP